MTSVEEDKKNIGKMKSEKISIDANPSDERRSFLNLSRENLSISHSEFEQGFNKTTKYSRVNRQTVLSVVAIVVALVCAGMEIWKLHRVVTNGRDIEILKRDVESLKHRMFGKDFMDELKAFEEQLYADDDGDEDSGEEDIDGTDYDNNYYEDYGPSLNDDTSEDTSEKTVSDSTKSTQGIETSSKSSEIKDSSANTSHNEKLVEMLAINHKIDAKHGLEKINHEVHKNIARERLLDGTRENGSHKRHHEKKKDDHPKQRRAITDETPEKYTVHGLPNYSSLYSRGELINNHTRQEIIEDSGENVAGEIKKKKRNPTTEPTFWDRYRPKKYFALDNSDSTHVFSRSRKSRRRHTNDLSLREELRGFQQDLPVLKKSLQPRGITRRHLRAPRQVFAAHYGADSTLFGLDDEHTGNGRAKHNEGVFKAWRASDWVADLGMTKHFTLSRDGKLTVHEPGLYLVYGQIHYLDEHDENGFHILINNQPILQCMVFSPGVGHKSRSCFSAQIIVLQSGDRLILKDVGPARYTLFQYDKSFFGLVKLGDARPQQQQQQQKHHPTQSPETLR